MDGYTISPIYPMYLYHKPAGLVSTMDDNWGRDCMEISFLCTHYHIVGRLDKDTRGLLLFSREGSLTQHLLHPKRAIEREYIATVETPPSIDLVERVEKGVETSLGLAKGKIVSITDTHIRLIMTEGRNRIVRRMLNNAGYPVVDLFVFVLDLSKIGELEEGHRKAITTKDLEQFNLKWER